MEWSGLVVILFLLLSGGAVKNSMHGDGGSSNPGTAVSEERQSALNRLDQLIEELESELPSADDPASVQARLAFLRAVRNDVDELDVESIQESIENSVPDISGS